MGFGWNYEDVGEYIKENNIDLEVVEPSDFEHGVYETKFYSKKYNVRFLCDGLLSYTDKRGNKEYMIFEIKTCGRNKFYALKDVLDEHKDQGICYCTLLGVKKELFFYSERDMMGKKAFIFEPTEKDKEALIKKLEYGNECVQNNIVPKKPSESADNKFCQYCNYQHICQQHGDNEVQL